MLILARKAGESVVLDGGIRLNILSTDGRTVRIGIEAPSHVRILRSEIVESVESETRRASGAAARWLAGQAPRAVDPAALAGVLPSLTPSRVPPSAPPPATEG